MDIKKYKINIKKTLKACDKECCTPKEKGGILFCKVADIFRDRKHESYITLDFDGYLDIDEELFLSFFTHIYSQEYGDSFLDVHLKMENLDSNAKYALECAWSKALKILGRGGYF